MTGIPSASSAHTLVRPSAIAGTWYPAAETALRRAIEGYLAAAQPDRVPGPVVALVSPHAGYAFSGGVAANAYAQVRGGAYQRVVLLGPLHRPIPGSRLGAIMVPVETSYDTPLGETPVDRAFLADLGRRVHLTPVRGDTEHSLEIELPFLQVALSSFGLVPLMMGEHVGARGALERLDALAAALAELADDKTLFVASTDLSHLDDYEDVVRIDRRLCELVAAFDVDGLAAALASEAVMACGAAGLVVALRAAQRLGARGCQVLRYAASGDVTGDKRPGTYTVGYLAAAAYR
jgi:AmmeMemoRadiSam system protein B